MYVFLFVLVGAGAISCSHTRNSATSGPDSGWISLFNGKNLDNWIPKISGYPVGENFGKTFRVENGLLSTRYNAYDSFKMRFGALIYKKKFSNYRLKVEYRFVGDTVRGAPSWGFRDGGIQYHCQSPQSMAIDQPFPVCLEYNLHGGRDGEVRPTGEICCSGMFVLLNGSRNTSYCNAPFVGRTFYGDVWVTAEIEVNHGKIRHFVNGEEILSFEDPQLDTTNKIAKNLAMNGSTTVSEGYISLQSNSHPMDFRKIEIRPIE